MRKNKGPEMVDKVVKIIINCKMKDFSFITAGWLAQQVNTTPANLSRAFKRETGKTLQRFLISQKISRAMSLLSKYQNINIKKVAAALDYNSSSQFSCAFKKIAGLSPSKFHSLMRKINSVKQEKIINFKN